MRHAAGVVAPRAGQEPEPRLCVGGSVTAGRHAGSGGSGGEPRVTLGRAAPRDPPRCQEHGQSQGGLLVTAQCPVQRGGQRGVLGIQVAQRGQLPVIAVSRQPGRGLPGDQHRERG